MNKNEGSTVFELLMLNFTNSKQLKNKCLTKFYTSEIYNSNCNPYNPKAIFT